MSRQCVYFGITWAKRCKVAGGFRHSKQVCMQWGISIRNWLSPWHNCDALYNMQQYLLFAPPLSHYIILLQYFISRLFFDSSLRYATQGMDHDFSLFMNYFKCIIHYQKIMYNHIDKYLYAHKETCPCMLEVFSPTRNISCFVDM